MKPGWESHQVGEESDNKSEGVRSQELVAGLSPVAQQQPPAKDLKLRQEGRTAAGPKAELLSKFDFLVRFLYFRTLYL